MTIEDRKVVSISYTLKNEEGDVLSASKEGEPLTYMHGVNSIIPGLEKALAGKEENDEFSVEIGPEEGYGEENPELVSVLRKEAFSGVDEIRPGMQFQARDERGNVQIITVKSVDADEVTVDRNHPLAGETLTFDVKVENVREPTEEELEAAQRND
ncbi:MAG: peptidylprolyl isomerase [Candidatus Aegiribacteria sp.]